MEIKTLKLTVESLSTLFTTASKLEAVNILKTSLESIKMSSPSQTFDQNLMNFEANRLRSFREWRLDSNINSFATPALLAASGIVINF